MASTPNIKVRRVYEPAKRGDGTRILVDRIWPRGVTKEAAHLQEWCKEVAPSTELRKWYGHDPARFAEFARRYKAELKNTEDEEALAHLRTLAKDRTLTLITATRDIDISGARVLADVLSHR